MNVRRMILLGLLGVTEIVEVQNTYVMASTRREEQAQRREEQAQRREERAQRRAERVQRREAERREAERQEAERREAERLEAVRLEAVRLGAARPEAIEVLTPLASSAAPLVVPEAPPATFPLNEYVLGLVQQARRSAHLALQACTAGGLAVPPSMEGIPEGRGTGAGGPSRAERMEFSESNVADRIKTSINSDFGQLEAEIAGMEADVNRSLSIFLEMCEGRRLERDAEKEAASCVWQALLMDIERKEEEIKAELERWSEAERARLAEERNRIVLEFQNLRASFALETMQDFSAAVGLISAQYMEAFRGSVGNGRDPNETERLLSIAREIEIDWLSEICADDMQAHDIWLADAIAQMERDIDEDLRESIDRMNAEYAAFCRAQKAMAQQREVVVQYVTTVDPLQVFETKDEGRQQVDTVVQQVVANCERIAAEVDQQLTAAANVSPEMVGTLSQAVHSGVQAAANVAAQGAAVAINRGVEVIRDGGTPETAQQEIAAVGEEADRNMHLQEYGLMEGSRGGVRNAMVNALRRACAADAFRILGTRALFALAVGGIVVPGVAAGWAWWTGGVTAIRALLAVALAGHPVLGIGAAAVAYVGITSGVALYGSGQPHHDEQPHHDGE